MSDNFHVVAVGDKEVDNVDNTKIEPGKDMESMKTLLLHLDSPFIRYHQALKWCFATSTCYKR